MSNVNQNNRTDTNFGINYYCTKYTKHIKKVKKTHKNTFICKRVNLYNVAVKYTKMDS